MPRSPAHPPVPTGCSRPSRQLLLAGDSTRDYESGGQEFESLRARTFGTVVLAEPGRYCAQPCHTLIASLSNTAYAGAYWRDPPGKSERPNGDWEAAQGGHPRQEGGEGTAQETHAAEASAVHHCRLGARTRPGSGGGAPNRQRPHEQS